MEVFVVSQNRRRRRFWLLFSFLVIYLLLLGSGWLIFWSPWLKVQEIDFQGGATADQILIKEYLVAHLIKARPWAAILTQANILFWSPAALKDFEEPAFIEELKLSRDFASRKVIVELAIRRPYGIWCPAERVECFWFDGMGILFSPSAAAEGFLIPKVVDFNPRPEKLDIKILEIFEIVNAVPQFQVAGILIKEKGLQEFEAKTASGLKLYFSQRFQPENLKDVLLRLSQEIELGKLEYIDFRVPNKVFYK